MTNEQCKTHNAEPVTAEAQGEGISVRYTCGCEMFYANTAPETADPHTIHDILDGIASMSKGRDCILDWFTEDPLLSAMHTQSIESSITGGTFQ